uniref:alpha-N-acetylgalactosaminide alpha-2,6-sialyltransferase n=1 Tax=Anas platyrhynchos TaxID=8839 RepID=A0A8B9QX35_ANAPL
CVGLSSLPAAPVVQPEPALLPEPAGRNFGEKSCSGRALHQRVELSGFPRASLALPIPSESHPEGEREGFPVSTGAASRGLLCHGEGVRDPGARGSPRCPLPKLTLPGLPPVLKASLSLLNTSASRLLVDSRQAAAPCVRCAVVGNGGILNGSRAGAAIDAHHLVFRVNGAITAGFEGDVGNRTSFYVFSTNTLVNALGSYAADGFKHPPRSPETRYVFLPDHDRDYLLLRAALTHQRVDRGRDKGVWPQEFFGEDLRADKFRMLHPDFIRYLRNRFLRSDILATPLWQLYRPSTGAVMLLAAIHTCDEATGRTRTTTSTAGHKEVQFYVNHDLKLEMRLWQRLQRSGLLRLYTGTEGT